MPEVRSLLLLALPGQLMLLASGVLTALVGFGRVAVLLVSCAVLGTAGLAAAYYRRSLWRGMVVLALLASSAGLLTTAWQVFAHLPPVAGMLPALMIAALAAGVFGPAIVAFLAALRSSR